ncbi:MAG: hypothetical protein NTZ64_07035 [Polaromonas sp.]|nr:hypothetical protein [Polaromonas sp.]
MQLSKEEMKSLLTACKELGSGPDYTCDDYIQNIMNMALDFQMNSKVVGASVDYFNETHGAKSHRKLRSLVNSFQNTKEGNIDLAIYLWNYKHWTRAKFLRKILDFFESHGIRGQRSLNRWVLAADFERDVQGQIKTEEHSIGFALFHWMRLRHGVNTVKPDVHVLKFVENAIGRRPSNQEAVDGLTSAAKSLRRKASRLDAAIWHFQRDDSA